MRGLVSKGFLPTGVLFLVLDHPWHRNQDVRRMGTRQYTLPMNDRKEAKRCWRIRGYVSTTEIFNQSVPIGQMTESGMRELLRALAARDLSPLEVIGAYAKRGTRISNGLLEIRTENQPEKRRTIYTCGHNPHYIVTTTMC